MFAKILAENANKGTGEIYEIISQRSIKDFLKESLKELLEIPLGVFIRRRVSRSTSEEICYINSLKKKSEWEISEEKYCKK